MSMKITVRISRETHERLSEIERSTGLDKSSVVRIALGSLSSDPRAITEPDMLRLSRIG